ncbi:hypothetical protein CU102_28775 [Phyllobacterium brassicacearum]|uniref:Uncharacterized protein n=1 Tax=Phyllobacterium brassicacearum TaxID=314235 RepID=A0A2P7AJT1_9HYPH|nr:hypothetical protein CU102_28775 [Phyllobacterium brassicacearum]
MVAPGGKCRAQPSVEAALPSITFLSEKLSFLIDSDIPAEHEQALRDPARFSYKDVRISYKKPRKWTKNSPF